MTSIWNTPDQPYPRHHHQSIQHAPPPPPPIFNTPVLYVSGITENVPDSAVVEALSDCLRLRPRISRETGSSYAEARGCIEFETIAKAEKAYATVQFHSFPTYGGSSLSLHITPPPSSDPVPQSAPRLIKNLSLDSTPSTVFDFCRPFGPVFRIAFMYAPAFPPGSGPDVFKGQAVAHWYDETHARRAMEELHCLEVEGSTITVQIFDPPRAKASHWAESPTFVSTGGGLSPVAPAWSPSSFGGHRSFSGSSSASAAGSMHGLGILPPGPGSANGSSAGSSWGTATKASAAAIDPCNLFIKSLDPTITSQDLHNLFAPFGSIVSARVMRDDATNQSREFGFVSYRIPEEAHAALVEMDGKRLGSRNIVVRLHEPKKVREERIRERMRINGLGEGEIEQLYEERERHKSHSGSPSRSRSPSTLFSRELSSSTSTSASVALDQPNEVPSSTPASSEILQTPPPASKLSVPSSEKDRLKEAVGRTVSEENLRDQIVDLLLGLPKKERALCLFNPEHLKLKIEDAKLVLSSSDDEEEDARKQQRASLPTPRSSPTPVVPPSTPMKKPLSIPTPTSLSALGALPAKTILVLLRDSTKPLEKAFGIERVEQDKENGTQEFMDGMEGKLAHEVKQKLGEKLFKVVKGTGVKGAPKITIQLLDSEELISLAHLIHYPIILREKAIHLSSLPTK